MGSILISVTDCDDKPELSLSAANFGIELFNGATNRLHVISHDMMEMKSVKGLNESGKYKIYIWFALLSGETILNMAPVSLNDIVANPSPDIVIGEINDPINAIVTVRGNNNRSGRTLCEILITSPRFSDNGV